MEENDNTFDFTKIDYGLNGYSVKRLLQLIDKKIERFVAALSVIDITKGIFYGFLKAFNLEKEFASYAKGCNEKGLYVTYLKMFLRELNEDLRKRARIFETEEEDRTNKRHRKCILNILPLVRKFAIFFTYFSVKICNNQGAVFGCNDKAVYKVSSALNRIRKGDCPLHKLKGWRNKKIK